MIQRNRLEEAITYMKLSTDGAELVRNQFESLSKKHGDISVFWDTDEGFIQFVVPQGSIDIYPE